MQAEDKENELVPKCWESLTEFVKGLLDYPNPITPLSNGQRPYKAADRMIHYAHIFTQLRKPNMAATPTK